jgi:hypothetical protein
LYNVDAHSMQVPAVFSSSSSSSLFALRVCMTWE